MDFFKTISCLSASHLRLARNDDSYVDRLSHKFTVTICIVFAIIVTIKQYAGDPIDCWVPAQFKASYEKYADSYCWITGSWYIPSEKELSINEREKKQYKVRYYQWVPFILLFQATLCYIPRVIWRCFNIRGGLHLVNLVDAAVKYESVDKFTDREKIMKYIVFNMERYVQSIQKFESIFSFITPGHQNVKTNTFYDHFMNYSDDELKNSENRDYKKINSFNRVKQALNHFKSIFFCYVSQRSGSYLILLYMIIKTLWLTNAISQLFLLNRFIGNDYHAFGIDAIGMLFNGQEWNELKHFPRVTYCDFKIREIGNAHDWTVQCVLRINLFNEVIFIFMWFWLCLLALLTIFDFISFIFTILLNSKLRFIKQHLYPQYQSHFNYKNTKENFQKESSSNEVTNNLLKQFTAEYLKDDGVFALRVLASNASDLIVSEIISQLWDNFKCQSELCIRVYEDSNSKVQYPCQKRSFQFNQNEELKNEIQLKHASREAQIAVSKIGEPIKNISK